MPPTSWSACDEAAWPGRQGPRYRAPVSDQLTADDFLPHVGSAFVATLDGREVMLELVDVRRYGDQPGAPREHPFSLEFAGPADQPLDQRTHRLAHRALGRLEIFLVPVQPGADDRPRYEAVFN